MKIFQKRGTAVLVLLLSLVAGIVIGQAKRAPVPVPEPGDSASATQFSYVYDYADILSTDTENYITKMNNGLYSLTGGEIAVITVPEYTGEESLSAYARSLGNSLHVGSADRKNGVVLLLDIENGNDSAAQVVAVAGDGISQVLTGQKITELLVSSLKEDFYSHNYDRGVTNTVDAFIRSYESYYGVDVLPRDRAYYQPVEPPASTAQQITSVLILILLMLFVWWILDYFRYSSYRKRYWQPGMGVPPYVYCPVFWGRHMGPCPPPARSAAAAPQGPGPSAGGGDYDSGFDGGFGTGFGTGVLFGSGLGTPYHHYDEDDDRFDNDDHFGDDSSDGGFDDDGHFGDDSSGGGFGGGDDFGGDSSDGGFGGFGGFGDDSSSGGFGGFGGFGGDSSDGGFGGFGGFGGDSSDGGFGGGDGGFGGDDFGGFGGGW